MDPRPLLAKAGGKRPSDDEVSLKRSSTPLADMRPHPRRNDSSRPSHPNPPLTPEALNPSAISQQLVNAHIPSAPASPPTPAPSPTPNHRPQRWNDNEDVPELENSGSTELVAAFRRASFEEKKSLLAALVDVCDSQLLSYLHHTVSPRLKKNPFVVLPNELCFKVLEFVDDARTFVRASQVSRRWRELLSDDQVWKVLCEKHAYRRNSTSEENGTAPNSPFMASAEHFSSQQAVRSRTESTISAPSDLQAAQKQLLARPMTAAREIPNATRDNSFLKAAEHVRSLKRPRPRSTHRSHFKHMHMVQKAWQKGGRMTSKHITPDQGVVTSLHLTKKHVIVALDNAKIHVFDVRGEHQRTLSGHVMGVWAMVPWGDTLVSGGCDRDVRVWNMNTGHATHTLRGHTSTVRCLKMSDANTAISGSRDTTLRIWDLKTGQCRHVLTGHQASVRCIEFHGDFVVSGSYDTTAKVWRISTGECLKTLQGHFSQIYAIAFDGKRVATGSLDTSVRIWNPDDGTCRAILQGHTSLVGQLQLRQNTLVTGGSDGSVRVWSLDTFTPIHRLAAHDNSVTSLQFDDSRIVSGGSDGRVKIWDLRTGTLIRELSQPAEAVWRVAFEEERAVVLASRTGKTVMEVWDFSPPDESDVRQDTSSPEPSPDPRPSLKGRPHSLSTSMFQAQVPSSHGLLAASFPTFDAGRRMEEIDGPKDVEMAD